MLLPTFLNQAVRCLMCEIKFLNRASQFLVLTKVVMEYTQVISTATNAYHDNVTSIVIYQKNGLLNASLIRCLYNFCTVHCTCLHTEILYDNKQVRCFFAL